MLCRSNNSDVEDSILSFFFNLFLSFLPLQLPRFFEQYNKQHINHQQDNHQMITNVLFIITNHLQMHCDPSMNVLSYHQQHSKRKFYNLQNQAPHWEVEIVVNKLIDHSKEG